MASDLDIFCRQIRSRSKDHARAFELLAQDRLMGQKIGILRQELDSLIRCIFLLATKDRNYRQRLISDSVQGRQWKTVHGRKKITDREMVELSDKLHGWTRSVYQFGCSFIHLSNFHDYENRDPLSLMAATEVAAINDHLKHYHGVTIARLPEIVHVLPRVLQKISDNLEWYVKELEANAELSDEL